MGITEGTWGFEHTKDVFITEVIPFMNSLRESFKDFVNGLHLELNKVKTIYNQMEAAVKQCSVDKKYFEIQKKELLIENDRLLELIISQDIVHTAVNSLAAIVDYQSMEKSYVDEYTECVTLKPEHSKKNEIVEKSSCPWNVKIQDLPPISSTLRKNKEVHEYYFKETNKHIDALRGIVEQARALEPSNNTLYYDCKYAQRIQKLLVCVNASCPSSQKDSVKPVAAKPQTRNSSTSTSGSQSKSNTRKNRITQATNSNKKNKTVEVHPRSVMSSLNKKNRVSMCNANTKHAVIDANSKFVCSTCNECVFSANHDKCVVAYLNDVNSNVKSKSVPWIYLGQFWHTLKEDGSKYRLKFMLNRKELTLTLDDFRTIFQLPQATDNNHEQFVATPKFSEMVPFYINDLGFTLELRSPSNFKKTDLEGLHYLLEYPSTLIPYPIFIKLIVSHYITAFPEISRRAHDQYHNLNDDMMVKNIFNSRKHKDGVGMKIPSWIITDEMKLTENYRMQSTRLTPPTPILTIAEVNDIILQDTIQLSLAEQKSRNELEAKENVQKVEEHYIAEEIKKLVGGAENVENVEVDSSTLRQDDTQNIPGTRLEPRSDKESPEVEITAEVQPDNINEEEEESAEDDYELKRREIRKHVEESRSTPSPTTIRSPRIHSTLISSDTEKL
ncbi:hypothetical protein Tco_0345366 [Tanacetum coccineum]